MLPTTPPPQRAREAVYRLIRLRPRSAREVEDHLKRKGFDAQAIRDTVAWARELGLVDDEAFARLWVNDRLARRPCGARLLRLELRRKGVDDEAIERALARAELDEPRLIRELIRARWALYPGHDPEARRRKLFGFLQRRGFAAEAVWAALREAERDPPAGP